MCVHNGCIKISHENVLVVWYFRPRAINRRRRRRWRRQRVYNNIVLIFTAESPFAITCIHYHGRALFCHLTGLGSPTHRWGFHAIPNGEATFSNLFRTLDSSSVRLYARIYHYQLHRGITTRTYKLAHVHTSESKRIALFYCMRGRYLHLTIVHLFRLSFLSFY